MEALLTAGWTFRWPSRTTPRRPLRRQHLSDGRMKPNETVAITTRDRVRAFADIEREGQKILQLGLPSFIDNHLKWTNRELKGFLTEYHATKQKKVGTKELARLCGTDVPAATRACREGRVAGAERGANGRWEMTEEAAEAYANGRRRTRAE